MPVSIRARLNQMLLFMTVLGVAIAVTWAWWISRGQVLHDVEDRARQHMVTAQAIRQYTETHVREALLADTQQFHPASVPSFAASTTLALLQKDYPDFDYREVALNPTVPAHQPQGWDRVAVDAFRANPDLSSLQSRDCEPGGQRWCLARPLRAKAACLSCHGQPEQAPAAMLARYGATHGFGWQVGEVVGAQVVSVNLAPLWGRVYRAMGRTAALSLGIMGLFFVIMNFALKRMVISPLQAHSDGWQRLASEDALTGLANRREFNLRAEQAVRWAEREHRPLSFIVLDLDSFKQLNDRFGHAEGDGVLRTLGQLLSQSTRHRDLPARLGGEEFALMVPGHDLMSAHQFAEALRHKVEFTVFPRGLPVTASLGVAQWQPGESVAETLQRADEALYRAKAAGRNTVCIAP
ncbi:diguanylate cyclase [Curvibacter sp. HBC61]|uniref:diguanylate cyclase n=1 Tax=Curvibacter cyanobacteriorum TaxID=3026422 RepID=A0ABT5MYC9_9BURK|nr:diguanylate cyclase [Curvibacter sp. HBC61]MDD0839059.1 diguanylate cyclase [Curvibacter sp. HBC61]